VEGWVEVDYYDLQPDRDFLELYYPNILKMTNNDLEFDNYIRVYPHTWIILNDEYIDITRNQFDKFGGILAYYENIRYIPIIKVTAYDIQNWYDERDYIIDKSKYIRYIDVVDKIKNVCYA
jgi:hypothetical protein